MAGNSTHSATQGTQLIHLDKRREGDNNSAMDWLAFAGTLIRRIPFERLLVPPRDKTKEAQEFMKTLQAPESASEPTSTQKAPVPAEKAKEVAYSGSTSIVTREGVDPQRIAWQDSLIRGELWLLEGHLKNNCVGCGGDLSCCFKHCQNIMDAARETQSMTTEPLYPDAVRVAEQTQPLVHPEDVKAVKYADQYPALAIKVSQIRTQFDKRVMGYARKSVTLEEAKQIAAEEAAKGVEEKWHSQEKKQ